MASRGAGREQLEDDDRKTGRSRKRAENKKRYASSALHPAERTKKAGSVASNKEDGGFRKKHAHDKKRKQVKSKARDGDAPFPKKEKTKNNKKRSSAIAATTTLSPNHSSKSGNIKSKHRRPSKKNAPMPNNFASMSLAPMVETSPILELEWFSINRAVPLAIEEEMLPVILRWGAKERGMMKDQPAFRVQQIRKQCEIGGMRLGQALSLRRHHMKLLNPFVLPERLGLGNQQDILQSATVFENVVAAYLDKCNVLYHCEKQQKKAFYRNKKKGDLMPPTPDFLLKQPVLLRGTNQILNWIEVKMFYGASTIPLDKKSAVGRIIHTAEKYRKNYGTGAMVFLHGCGERLEQQLSTLGVVALDEYPIDLTDLRKSQRKWCANAAGEILV